MRYIIGVFAALLVLIFVFVLIFTKGNSSQSPTQSAAQVRTLMDYAQQNSSVTLTSVGKVVGVEEQRSIRVVVSSTERRLDILSGFGETVLSTQSFTNTQAASDNFLAALDGQRFLTSKKTTITDPRSHCPSGQRYEYKLAESETTISDLWSVSCDKIGTYGGRTSLVKSLFTRQIPDYNRLVSGVQL